MNKRVLISCSLATGLMALLLVLCACQRASGGADTSPASTKIQSKARVFDLTEPDNGFTKVGIMAAFDPKTQSFWWRPTPMIAEASMLERYFERCKFQRISDRVVSFCVRGNELVINHTHDSASSIDQGLDMAQSKLQKDPGLLMTYQEPLDRLFNLKAKAGVDMNTGEGVAPTSVRSVRKVGPGWELDVTCGCGDAVITLSNDLDFISFKRT
jgi:hypothetical protein